jgi:hypothetical protein
VGSVFITESFKRGMFIPCKQTTVNVLWIRIFTLSSKLMLGGSLTRQTIIKYWNRGTVINPSIEEHVSLQLSFNGTV